MRAKSGYSNSSSGTCICVLTLVNILSHTKVVRLAIFSFPQAKVCTVGWMHQCCEHWCRKQYLRRSQISRYHTSHHYTQAIPLVSSCHIGIVEFIVYYSWELLLFIDGGIMVQFPAGTPDFSFSKVSTMVLGPIHPSIQWVPWALSLGVKQPGYEADYSPPCSADLRICGTIDPLPHMPLFHAQGQFYLAVGSTLSCVRMVKYECIQNKQHLNFTKKMLCVHLCWIY